MRDITGDLKERIEATQAELALVRTEYEAAKRDLESTFSGRYNRTSDRLQALELLYEDETGLRPSNVTSVTEGMRLPLQDFILNAISVSGTKNKDEIKDAVERSGYVKDRESAGRMVHTTLMNMVKAGRIQMMSDGQYTVNDSGFFK